MTVHIYTSRIRTGMHTHLDSNFNLFESCSVFMKANMLTWDGFSLFVAKSQ